MLHSPLPIDTQALTNLSPPGILQISVMFNKEIWIKGEKSQNLDYLSYEWNS